MPQVLFIWCHLGSSFSGSGCCGASPCPAGVEMRDAETEPPPCLTPCPAKARCLPPPITPQTLHPWLCKALQRRGEVTSPPQQLPEVFHKTPAESFYSRLQGAPSSAALQDRGAPRPCRAVQVPPGTSTCPTISISRQLLGKRRHQPREDPGGKPRWRSLIEL